MRLFVLLLSVVVMTSCSREAPTGGSGTPASAPPPAASSAPVSAAAPQAPAPSMLAASMAGWTRRGEIQRFGPGNLWEYINGGAEQYLSFGFQDLESAKYGRPNGATVMVDAYRMADRLHAFGIYAQESNPKRKPVKVGVEGRVGAAAVEFWAASHYVKIVADPSKTVPPDDLVGFARAVAAELGEPGGMPAEVALVPTGGLVAGTIRFVPEDALGQAAFVSALEAQFEGAPKPSTLFLIPFKSPAQASEAATAYAAFLTAGSAAPKTLPSLADGGFSTTERYYGRIVAARIGRWVVISLGADTDEHAATLVRAAAVRVAASASTSIPGAQR